VSATTGPPIPLLVGAFLLVLLVGELAWSGDDAQRFAIAFVLGAALPPFIALGVALRRLQTDVSWRVLVSATLIGTAVSTNLAIALEIVLPSAIAALVLPLRDLLSALLEARSLEELLFNRGLVVVFIEVAIVAPLAEELTKPLGVVLLGRWIRDRRQAFLVGMAGGVGFAVLENMFYEGVWAGHEWLAVTAGRGIGGALHPLGAGLIALAIYDLRHGRAGWGRLGGAYALAVAIHMAWNGGLVMLYSTIGDRLAGGGPTFALSGIEESAIVLAWLIALSVLVWRLLFVVTASLRDADGTPAPLMSLGLDQPRRLALSASGLLVAALAAGEIWGPVLARQLERAFG
jgi:RsiW-degrading membrane proteinase PrsW (M82 family)